MMRTHWTVHRYTVQMNQQNFQIVMIACRFDQRTIARARSIRIYKRNTRRRRRRQRRQWQRQRLKYSLSPVQVSIRMSIVDLRKSFGCFGVLKSTDQRQISDENYDLATGQSVCICKRLLQFWCEWTDERTNAHTHTHTIISVESLNNQ